MINAILFDKDGTLFDFYRTWGPVTEDAALLVAGGDFAKARYVLEKSGKDMVTGKYVLTGGGLKDRTGATLLLITHDRTLAKRCDRIVSLADGRIVIAGAKRKVAAS